MSITFVQSATSFVTLYPVKSQFLTNFINIPLSYYVTIFKMTFFTVTLFIYYSEPTVLINEGNQELNVKNILLLLCNAQVVTWIKISDTPPKVLSRTNSYILIEEASEEDEGEYLCHSTDNGEYLMDHVSIKVYGEMIETCNYSVIVIIQDTLSLIPTNQYHSVHIRLWVGLTQNKLLLKLKQ